VSENDKPSAIPKTSDSKLETPAKRERVDFAEWSAVVEHCMTAGASANDVGRYLGLKAIQPQIKRQTTLIKPVAIRQLRLLQQVIANNDDTSVLLKVWTWRRVRKEFIETGEWDEAALFNYLGISLHAAYKHKNNLDKKLYSKFAEPLENLYQAKLARNRHA